MTQDISKIREELKNCEEVDINYEFPYKCWIKYITIKGEDEAFYTGGEFIGKGDHKLFLVNKGKRLTVPTCVRDDDGETIYKSRFFIDSIKNTCKEKTNELEKIIKAQQLIIKKNSEHIKLLETEKQRIQSEIYEYVSEINEKNNTIKELEKNEKKYKLVLSKYIK